MSETTASIDEELDKLAKTAMLIAYQRNHLLRTLRGLIESVELHGADSQQFFDARNDELILLETFKQ